MRSTTVRIFSSHPIAAEQYEKVLSGEKDLRVVRKEDPFQVGLFDSESASIEAVLTMARLRFPAMRPLLMAFPQDENDCLRWLFRGVWGMVPFDRYKRDLPRAVRRLAEGQLWFPAPVIVRWMRISEARRASSYRISLSKREKQIMELLLRRFSNREIAEISGVSERTVKYHVSNILNKLQVTSREELTAKWVPNFGVA
ncbi:MAG: response regulator transcription factor [Acidobacteria bacterium]|nr:response regulator transcription factor [Acidobacteriota bacterium]